MIQARRILVPLAAVLLLLSGAMAACDGTSAQRDFEAQAWMPPSGITPTDADGNLTGDPDPDDWRTAPLFPGVVVEPAFPNPVPVGFTDPVQVHVNVPFPGNISGGMQMLIWDIRPPERLRAIDVIESGSIFHFNTFGFTRADVQRVLSLPDPAGLYRVFIQDGAGRMISYGDILIE